MRIFTTCKESVREIERDLWEMGIEVQTYSMQDKVIEGDESFFTKEVSPYSFQITKPMGDPEEFINYLHPEEKDKLLRWCKAELKERVADYNIAITEVKQLQADIDKAKSERNWYGYYMIQKEKNIRLKAENDKLREVR